MKFQERFGRLVGMGWVVPLLLGVIFFPEAAIPTTPARPFYEVYAISYAILPGFPVAELVAGADPSRKMDIQMLIWVLKGPNGRNILVDSGFYREKFFKSWTVKNYLKPSEAIDKVGLKPEQITDLILTHAHWDHADGVDLFPNAQVWIQKEEFSYYSDPAKQVKGIDPEDMAVLIRLNREHRVTLVNGDNQPLIPGITFYTGGRHTYASQYISVNTRAGTVVVASDNVYLYENIEKHAPIAATFDAASNLKAQDRMKILASELRLIVPGHDPAVFEKFPKPGNGVARIDR
jgi:glyoxylase-like metal-dependent hydrolase (beta-lactamase superfamily II)